MHISWHLTGNQFTFAFVLPIINSFPVAPLFFRRKLRVDTINFSAFNIREVERRKLADSKIINETHDVLLR